MQKIWQLSAPIDATVINGNPEYHPVVLQLLYNRGLRQKIDFEAFLAGDYDPAAASPFLFRDMEAACQLIIKHIKVGNKITICADYDADGVTAAGIMTEVLATLKAEVEVWIPTRFGEGYGLNKKVVQQLAEAGTKLLITVDNGIKSQAETALAQELGMEVIITDHHKGADNEADLPKALIINPILTTETYPWRYLCGAGVAYKLASALITLSSLEENIKDQLRQKVLDLAAIGTIADCVSLLGENRWLVKQGLAVINRRPRLGLRELMRVAQITPPVNEWQVGWQIAPRLNVAGRLDHANTAYQLLITKNPDEAKTLANQLQEKNIKRQKMTEEIFAICDDIVKREQIDDNILVLLAPNLFDETKAEWTEGVIGLVAGRLCEAYHRPTVVICWTGGQAKGSCRSIAKFDITVALDEVKDVLSRYGGHKQAAGLALKDKNLALEFSQRLKAIGQRDLQAEDLLPIVKVEAEMKLADLDGGLVDQIAKLSPFGQNNPEPILVSREVMIRDVVTMGSDKQHLKLKLHNFWAVAFNAANKWGNLTVGEIIDVIYTVEWNEFNNRRDVQLKIVDLKLCQS